MIATNQRDKSTKRLIKGTNFRIFENFESRLPVNAFLKYILYQKALPGSSRKRKKNRVTYNSVSLTIRLQSSQKFKNLWLWLVLIVSQSLMLFMNWVVVPTRKLCSLFLKKGVCPYHFCVSQNEAWKLKMEAAARTRRPRVNIGLTQRARGLLDRSGACELRYWS